MNKELDRKIKELRELKRMAKEIQTEIDGIQDAIKAEMKAANVDVLTGSDWKATWREVVSSRLDSKALKAAFPDVARQFMKSTVNNGYSFLHPCGFRGRDVYDGTGENSLVHSGN